MIYEEIRIRWTTLTKFKCHMKVMTSSNIINFVSIKDLKGEGMIFQVELIVCINKSVSVKGTTLKVQFPTSFLLWSLHFLNLRNLHVLSFL